MMEMKKELAKAVKAVRDSYEKTKYPTQYPKLMMTAVQMAKGTATINCGYHSIIDNEKAERILSDPTINELLTKYNATMKKEMGAVLPPAQKEMGGKESWQVRIYY